MSGRFHSVAPYGFRYLHRDEALTIHERFTGAVRRAVIADMRADYRWSRSHGADRGTARAATFWTFRAVLNDPEVA